MKNLLVKLQSLSNTFLGVNILNDSQKTKTHVFKSTFYVVLLIFIGVISVYRAFFDSNEKIQEKLQSMCCILSVLSFLMIFIGFWCNEDQYQLLTSWIQARYAPRSFKLIDDIAKVAFGALSTRMWMIPK